MHACMQDGSGEGPSASRRKPAAHSSPYLALDRLTGQVTHGMHAGLQPNWDWPETQTL